MYYYCELFLFYNIALRGHLLAEVASSPGVLSIVCTVDQCNTVYCTSAQINWSIDWLIDWLIEWLIIIIIIIIIIILSAAGGVCAAAQYRVVRLLRRPATHPLERSRVHHSAVREMERRVRRRHASRPPGSATAWRRPITAVNSQYTRCNRSLNRTLAAIVAEAVASCIRWSRRADEIRSRLSRLEGAV